MVTKQNSLASRDSARKQYRHPIKNKRGIVRLNIELWRIKTIVILIVTCVLVTTYTLFFSSYFTVTDISFSSPQYIKYEEMQSAIDEYFLSKKNVLFNKKNFFIINTNKLTLFLSERFLFSFIEIDKTWPNKIYISFADKPSFIVLASFTGDEWSIINHNAQYLKTIKPFNAGNSLPLLWTAETNPPASSVELLLMLYYDEMLNSVFNVEYFLLSDQMILRAITKEGFYIEFNLEEEPVKQLERLKIVADELKKNQTLPKEYLLIHYNEKVFYR